MLIASNFLLWVVVALLVVAVLALARQIGILHERIAPMGALVTQGGPRAGDMTKPISAPRLAGGTGALGGPSPSGTAVLALFVAPDCPVCKKMAPLAMAVAKTEGLKLVFIGDGEASDYRKLSEKLSLEAYDLLLSREIGTTYEIDKLPSAVLIGADGKLVGKGLVNTREHLESLVNAGETGFASAQDYIRSLPLHHGPKKAASNDTEAEALPHAGNG